MARTITPNHQVFLNNLTLMFFFFLLLLFFVVVVVVVVFYLFLFIYLSIYLFFFWSSWLNILPDARPSLQIKRGPAILKKAVIFSSTSIRFRDLSYLLSIHFY